MENNKINSTHWTIILICAICLLGCALYEHYHLKNELEAANSQIKKLTIEKGDIALELAKSKNDYLELKSNESSQTVIQYVEKSSKDDADFQIDKTPPKVVINAGDGNVFTYSPDSKSYQNIKDGKVVVTEENTLNLDIEKIVDSRFKDRIEAINSKHELELQAVNDQLNKTNDKLKITKKQRDFYAGAFITTVSGGIIIGASKNF
ncbi:MAG: hypothetical protein SPF22_08045 [Candidatus Onthovivens sp.]|nr:hypothetical protein [Candidatus Onthovivens sp.]